MKALNIGAIILAAGTGSRMGIGGPKVILPMGGRPLLKWVVNSALEARCRPVIIVVGHRADEVMNQVPAPAEVQYVVNPRYKEGMGTSLAAGVEAVMKDPRVEAAAVLLGDQPLVRGEHVTALTKALASARWEAASEPEAELPVAARASFQGTPGHPVIIHRDLFPELTRLQGDEGARRIIKHHPSITVPFADAGVIADVDRWSDYKAMAREAESGGQPDADGGADGSTGPDGGAS